MIQVPFGNLKRHYEHHQSAIDSAIERVLKSGWFILGEQCEKLEEEMAVFHGVRHAIGVASGTDAISLSLRALGVGPGDEVITVANTCIPSISAISALGAVPVLCDVDKDTYLMNLGSLEQCISSKTKAVVPVHLYGHCVDMPALLSMLRGSNIRVVEDCAQAIDAKIGSRRAGTFGACGAFSFYPSKNLGAFGDGGMILTDDPEIADKLKMYRNYGQSVRYKHDVIGVNSRLDEIQAAILRVKLPLLPGDTAKRRQIAHQYSSAFASLPIKCPCEREDYEHNYHLYVIQVPERSKFMEFLKEMGVQSLIHYPIPVHLQTAYQRVAVTPTSLGVTEEIANNILSLPLYPELTSEEISHVIRSVTETCRKLERVLL
jgi:dTDP-4-amino-4,6-dideoxygalactose transaminase